MRNLRGWCAAGLAALALTALAQQAGQWFAFQPAEDDFKPNVLDCSRWVEAPTGRHGFLRVKGDRFVFEDGRPARFFGAQIGSIRNEQVDYTLRRMRRQGINIVRQHGLEALNDRNGKTFFDYSKEGFDRLDYLISKLGENGIYIILDTQYPLHTRIRPGDGIPELPEGGTAGFAQFFHEKIAKMTQQRMVDVYTHYNPYTKKRYCDDPTIAMVEVANEDSVFFGSGVTDPFRPTLEARYAEWLRKKYANTAKLRQEWNTGDNPALGEGEGIDGDRRVRLLRNYDYSEKYFGANPEKRKRAVDQLRFLLELEDGYWQECRRVLRQAGVKVPISGTNWQGHGFTTKVHLLGQSRLDYLDRHGYWDHPQGQGNLQWNIATCNFHNLPMVKDVRPDQDRLIYLGVENLVTEKAWEQILDLPMTVSEWNTCLPNEHSLEGTGLMTAYGLLQGWDASMQFGYFSADWRPSLGRGSFDLFGNPPQILQFPPAAAMWYRGDVKEAGLVAESIYDSESAFELKEDVKPLPIAAALVGKVGYRFVRQSRKPVVNDIGKYWDPARRVARSITGELAWDAANGIVTVNTPRTQAAIGFLSVRPHELSTVVIRSSTRFGAVYVTGMDDRAPIRTARRLLVTTVGPARNTGMEYEETSRKSRFGTPYLRLKAVGDAPALLEAISGDIEIRSSRAAQLKAWTLDVVGTRRKEVRMNAGAGTVRLALQPEDSTVYYELAER